MKSVYANTLIHNPQNRLWSTPVRVLHWLTAICLVGAASYTDQGDILHSVLGWMALGMLLILHNVYAYSAKTNWALWFVTAVVTAMNLSGWLNPDHTVHVLVTFSGVMSAAFYFATVVFESLNLLITRIFNQDPAM